MAFVHKAASVRVVLEDGRSIRMPAVMLHDETGQKWGRTSVLFVPSFSRTGEEATEDEMQRMKIDPRAYLGKNYRVKKGELAIVPPRRLSDWTRVGTIDRIYYSRTGTRHPKGPWHHPFGRTRLFPFPKKGRKPVLYEWGSSARIELGSDAVLDDRGFVWP